MDTPRDGLRYQNLRLTAVGTMYILCLIPRARDFLVSLTHVSLPSRPKLCHKISAHKVSSRLFSCHLSLNALEDQLDRHGRRPCAQRQLLGLKNTTQRNVPRSYWDKLSLLPSPLPNSNRISCPPRVGFDFVDISDSVCTEGIDSARDWICWAASCKAHRAINMHEPAPDCSGLFVNSKISRPKEIY